MKKYAALFALISFFFLPLLQPAYAQSQNSVNLQAQAGLAGVCQTGGWIPIRVVVENNGAGFEARVQASHQSDFNRQSISAINLSLPASSRKEFFLYVYSNNALRSVTVRVMEGETIRAEKKLGLVCGANDLNFGVIAESPSAYNILNDINSLNGGRTRVINLKIEDLPDAPQGWQALDALLISGVDTGQLTAAQKHAMRVWIANGGKLLVTGGIHWQTTTAGLNGFLPLEINATRNVTSLASLSAFIRDSQSLEGAAILSDGAIQPGAHLLAEQDGAPLLIEKRIGYGKVYFLAADPAMPPLNNWQGMKQLYEHLLAFQPEKPSWTSRALDSYQANNALSALPELALPSFFYICCWLGLYVAAIGPINYIILRRLKRTELAWLTIPVTVVIFSCTAYFFGLVYRGNDPILNRLLLAQSWQDETFASANVLAGVYSPERGSYEIETTEGFMLYKVDELGGGFQPADRDWLVFKTGQGMRQPDTQVEIGGMIPVAAEGVLPDLQITHDLKFTPQTTSTLLEGTIANQSQTTLRDAFLILPGQWIPLGNLPPGASHSVSNSISNDVVFTRDFYTAFSSINLPVYPVVTEEDARRRSTWLQALMARYNNGYSMVNSGAYLAAWVDDIHAPVQIRNKTSTATDTTLYIQKLEPLLETDARALVLSLNLYEWQSSSGAIVTYQIPAEGYELRLQPAVPVDFTSVTSFELNIQTTAAYDKSVISLWDVQTNSWRPLDSQPAPILVADPARFIFPDGSFRIRLDANPNDYVGVTSINFNLQVAR